MPKYNPGRRETFSLPDWRYVCGRASDEFRDRELKGIVQWINDAGQLSKPRKEDQDRLDACLCLLVALHLTEGKESLMVGDLRSGYIVVPYSAELHGELAARCEETGRLQTEWLRVFCLRG
jgi:predicted RNase H-like nuclease